jgi:predicted Zn-dependent protease
MRLTSAQAVEVALDHARRITGVVDFVAVSSHDSSASLRWANNTLTTNGYGWSNGLVLVAYVAKEGGVATAELYEVDQSFDAASVRVLVDRAVALAKESEPAKRSYTLPGDISYGNWDAAPFLTDLTLIGNITPSLGEVLSRGAREHRNHSGYAEHGRVSTWTGSLSGIRIREDNEDGRVEMTSRSNDGVRSAWEGVHSRTFTDLDIHTMGANLERQLGWQNNRRELVPGRYRTILPPGAVGDLVTTFDSNLVGRHAVEGSGPFARPNGGTMLGERIAGARSYNLYSDPQFPGLEESPFVVNTHDGPASSVFDTGQPLPRVDWVRDGVLNALCTSRTVAEDIGLPFTPNVGNLILDVPGGHGTLDEVIARTEQGLLVNCLWYIRDLDEATMMVTGTTRDGVYEIRDGEVVGAVNNFRFNESPMSVLSRIHDAGSSVLCQTRENAEYISDFLMPTLVVDDFNMSSVSDAL